MRIFLLQNLDIVCVERPRRQDKSPRRGKNQSPMIGLPMLTTQRQSTENATEYVVEFDNERACSVLKETFGAQQLMPLFDALYLLD